MKPVTSVTAVTAYSPLFLPRECRHDRHFCHQARAAGFFCCWCGSLPVRFPLLPTAVHGSGCIGKTVPARSAALLFPASQLSRSALKRTLPKQFLQQHDKQAKLKLFRVGRSVPAAIANSSVSSWSSMSRPVAVSTAIFSCRLGRTRIRVPSAAPVSPFVPDSRLNGSSSGNLRRWWIASRQTW